MEKFKNALKSVNKFGLLALVLVAFSTLAFKAPEKSVTGQKYGYDQITDSWVLIEGKTMDNSSNPTGGTYSCDLSVETCSGVFSTPPIDHTSIPEGSSRVPGDFTLN